MGKVRKKILALMSFAILFPAYGTGEAQTTNGVFTGVIDVGTARSHSYAIKNDGTLWTWGENTFGELGNETRLINAWAPTKVKLEGVKDLSGGVNFSVALKDDGTVWAWGWNHGGMLGIGRTDNAYFLNPQKLEVENVSSITSALATSFAVLLDGTVWGWGNNFDGRLGVSNTLDTTKPLQIPNLRNVVKVASNGDYHLALTEAGDVWGWGHHRDEIRLPHKINTLSGITDISASTLLFTALKSDGTVWGWESSEQPEEITGIPKIKVLAEGNFPGLIDLDGIAWIWEKSGLGFKKLTAIPKAKQLTSSGTHWLIMTESGQIYAWGRNKEGQLGINQVIESVDKPVSVMKPISVVLDKKTLELPISPLLISSRTLIPLRGVLEQMGVEVTWSHEQRTVFLTKGEKRIELMPGSAEAKVDGETVLIDQSSTIVNDRVLVPLRFVSETMGATVSWDVVSN